jgi:hypothetical protein
MNTWKLCGAVRRDPLNCESYAPFTQAITDPSRTYAVRLNKCTNASMSCMGFCSFWIRQSVLETEHEMLCEICPGSTCHFSDIACNQVLWFSLRVVWHPSCIPCKTYYLQKAHTEVYSFTGWAVWQLQLPFSSSRFFSIGFILGQANWSLTGFYN